MTKTKPQFYQCTRCDMFHTHGGDGGYLGHHDLKTYKVRFTYTELNRYFGCDGWEETFGKFEHGGYGLSDPRA